MPPPDIAVSPPIRVFLSYAHDDHNHTERVRRFAAFLRQVGIDAHTDLPAAEQPQDWPLWMLGEIRSATFVLIIASPQYRRRAEGLAPPDQGRGVQWETRIIRNEVYGDQPAALHRFLPVVLPGGSPNDIPTWLGGVATTHYSVTEYTVQGAEKLLRYLTNQPFELAPELGTVPVLPPRALGTPTETDLIALVRTVAARAPTRNDPMVQAQIRQFLAAGPLGLTDSDLGAEVASQTDDRRRFNIRAGCAVVEVRADLRLPGLRAEAEQALVPYVAGHGRAAGQRYAAILTDGAEWWLYRQTADVLQVVSRHAVDATNPDVDALVAWLEAAMATNRRLEPSPQQILSRLGAESPAHGLDVADLGELYDRNQHLPSVAIKRQLWAKLLTTALGTNFTDDDALFVDHTLLVIMAEIIGHAVVGIPPDDPDISAAEIMSGRHFATSDVFGVIEPDFFDWVVDVAGGEEFVKGLARRLTRFAWGDVEHDVMKVLYESIIGPETRHRLGEYYTPDWLAEEIVAACVKQPLNQRVVDASCGSGTFLFHAARSYLSAAERCGQSNAEAVQGLIDHVIGIDVHPVAVTLARVTYLLAMGMQRIQADDRPALAVPVYLGDALRWGDESHLLTYAGLDVSTSDDHEIFADRLASPEERLQFPDRVVDNAATFDRLVNELAAKATERRAGSAPQSLRATFERFGIAQDDQSVLTRTFHKMCELHDQSRDHIWAYYVRNLARPLWLARPNHRVDVLVGNPPWLAYRYMTRNQQASFRTMSKQRGLWTGATVATNQDLSALFVTRCIELYLKPGGRFGYVMPWATLSRQQYAGFRTGKYSVSAEPVHVAFERPWDLHLVKPSFFPVPACVVFGRRNPPGDGAAALSQVPEMWSGRFATSTASRAEAAKSVGRTIGEPAPLRSPRGSPYAIRFAQGATVVPRVLFLIEPDQAPRLGAGAGRRAVRSRRSSNEKKPWKNLPALHGIVERQFIRRLYLGDSLLPFRSLEAAEAVFPWDGERLLYGSDDRLDRHPGLAAWWRMAEQAWAQNRSSDRMELWERLDFRRGLSQQLPVAGVRVIYAASGMYMAAAVITDESAFIEHKLYWGSVDSSDEARFLIAILNSTVLTHAVRPLQGRGEHNPRDFDKYIWQLPIPRYDARDSAHRWLVALAERAEQVASGVPLSRLRFEALRRRVRLALEEDGVAADIDAIVKTLLA
jgi:SAM-dependent methyltransferase